MLPAMPVCDLPVVEILCRIQSIVVVTSPMGLQAPAIFQTAISAAFSKGPPLKTSSHGRQSDFSKDSSHLGSVGFTPETLPHV